MFVYIYIYCSTTSCPTQQLTNLCFSLKVKASSSVDQSCRKTAPQHIKSCSTKVWNGLGLRSKVSIPKCDPHFCHCSSFSANHRTTKRITGAKPMDGSRSRSELCSRSCYYNTSMLGVTVKPEATAYLVSYTSPLTLLRPNVHVTGLQLCHGENASHQNSAHCAVSHVEKTLVEPTCEVC